MKYANKGRDVSFRQLNVPTIAQSQWQRQDDNGVWITTCWDRPHGQPIALKDGYALTNLRMNVVQQWYTGMHCGVVHIQRGDYKGETYTASSEPSPYFWEVVAMVPCLHRDDAVDAILRRTDRLVSRGLTQ